ncbi:MAG: energy-coupling factor transporter transmembrane protein EcfT, partial [Leptolyngbya sp. SIO1D8]|nr:energy-coupling factor transporter transmembrane protein EcfT [Leptolyngbya sp. SIO1D8]
MHVVQQHKPTSRFLTPINPFLKIALSILLISFSLLIGQLPAMLLLVGGLLLMCSQLKIRLPLLAYSMFMLTLFTGLSALLLGNWPQAFFATLRLLAILLPVPVLALTTPPADLIRSLQAARLPSFLTLSLMLIWRFFPLMQEELQRIWDANQLRGIDLRRRPRQWFSGLIVPLIFQI